jgi:hypothetical protein
MHAIAIIAISHETRESLSGRKLRSDSKVFGPFGSDYSSRIGCETWSSSTWQSTFWRAVYDTFKLTNSRPTFNWLSRP